MCREYTKEEVQRRFIEHVRIRINYWAHESRVPTVQEKLEGLAHSILVILDGESVLPSFIVAPQPHPDDKQYNKDNEDNWFPENHDSKVNCNIAGNLHELLFKK